MLTLHPHPDADMTEETPSADKRRIRLTEAESNALFVALQWPEDRVKAIKLTTPTNLTEIGF